MNAAVLVKEYFPLAENIAILVLVPYRPPKTARKSLRVELDDDIDVLRPGMGDSPVLAGNISVITEIDPVFE